MHHFRTSCCCQELHCSGPRALSRAFFLWHADWTKYLDTDGRSAGADSSNLLSRRGLRCRMMERFWHPLGIHAMIYASLLNLFTSLCLLMSVRVSCAMLISLRSCRHLWSDSLSKSIANTPVWRWSEIVLFFKYKSCVFSNST